LPGSPERGVNAVALDLAVFGATATVALRFDGCIVPDEQVIAVHDADAWRRADRRSASLGQPAVLGVAGRACSLLAEVGDGDATSAAATLAAELAERWRIDDRLAAALTTGDDAVAEASLHRAGCLDLARRSTTALLAAVGGSGVERSHPAQRLAREADFYVIQAQTADGRAATLRHVTTTAAG
jgi:hypothetical protein